MCSLSHLPDLSGLVRLVSSRLFRLVKREGKKKITQRYHFHLLLFPSLTNQQLCCFYCRIIFTFSFFSQFDVMMLFWSVLTGIRCVCVCLCVCVCVCVCVWCVCEWGSEYLFHRDRRVREVTKRRKREVERGKNTFSPIYKCVCLFIYIFIFPSFPLLPLSKCKYMNLQL